MLRYQSLSKEQNFFLFSFLQLLLLTSVYLSLVPSRTIIYSILPGLSSKSRYREHHIHFDFQLYLQIHFHSRSYFRSHFRSYSPLRCDFHFHFHSTSTYSTSVLNSNSTSILTSTQTITTIPTSTSTHNSTTTYTYTLISS